MRRTRLLPETVVGIVKLSNSTGHVTMSLPLKEVSGEQLDSNEKYKTAVDLLTIG